MNTYTGFNIGPIVDTLSLAKRPRELWSASYLFSYLMQCIISKISVEDDVAIISPALLSEENDTTVGLYPDRVFVKGSIDSDEIIKSALDMFATEIGVKYELIKKYINIMSVSIEKESENEALQELNRYLDFTELNNRSVDEDGMLPVLKLIRKKYNSPLFNLAFNNKQFEIASLSEIATVSLSNNEEWGKICTQAKIEERINEDIPEAYRIPNEDFFYKEIKDFFKNEYKSYHKYICIVQADGDNMGSVISNSENKEVSTLSKALLNFGTAACQSIRNFGGLPIYAGGDDLLFISPVVSKDQKTIFDLISDIDTNYSVVQSKVAGLKLPKLEGNGYVKTSMSYGISISYYKFPLYEALSSARSLLFGKAKNIENKDAIAWNLQKHSGSSFYGSFSKSDASPFRHNSLYTAFKEVVVSTVDDKLVTAVAHKLRANDAILSLLIGKKEEDLIKRLDAFFEKVMDIGKKDDPAIKYLNAVQALLVEIYKMIEKMTIKRDDGTIETDKETIRKQKAKHLVLNIYGMLRTAKFINGEGDDYE